LAEIGASACFAAADLRLVPASPGKAERLRPLLGHPRATLYVNLEEAGLITGPPAHRARRGGGASAAGARRAVVTDGHGEAVDATRRARFRHAAAVRRGASPARATPSWPPISRPNWPGRPAMRRWQPSRRRRPLLRGMTMDELIKRAPEVAAPRRGAARRGARIHHHHPRDALSPEPRDRPRGRGGGARGRRDPRDHRRDGRAASCRADRRRSSRRWRRRGRCRQAQPRRSGRVPCHGRHRGDDGRGDDDRAAHLAGIASSPRAASAACIAGRRRASTSPPI
jgi:hypothetical protein